MSTETKPNKPISRRSFLKLGCAGTAAVGLTVCGATGLAPDPAPTELSTFTYGEQEMQKRILIAYASAFGSTVDVAATIGETLAGNDLAVDVKPIEENPPIDGYQAVVIGSAVQHGNWLPEAVEFVKDNQAALNELPVALFCVHITNLGDDETSRQNRRVFLDAVRPLVAAVDEAYFAGKFDRRGAKLMLPGFFARFVPPLDFRKWKKMRAWAERLRPLLTA
jgi:menaquinone-dependent protoporphyrinogen oxidase